MFKRLTGERKKEKEKIKKNKQLDAQYRLSTNQRLDKFGKDHTASKLWDKHYTIWQKIILSILKLALILVIISIAAVTFFTPESHLFQLYTIAALIITLIIAYFYVTCQKKYSEIVYKEKYINLHRGRHRSNTHIRAFMFKKFTLDHRINASYQTLFNEYEKYYVRKTPSIALKATIIIAIISIPSGIIYDLIKPIMHQYVIPKLNTILSLPYTEETKVLWAQIFYVVFLSVVLGITLIKLIDVIYDNFHQRKFRLKSIVLDTLSELIIESESQKQP